MNKLLKEMMANEKSDPVTEVLRGIRLLGSFYSESTFTAPWGFESPAYGIALFHFVVKGAYWLGQEGRDPLRVNEGEMVLLPHGQSHHLSDVPGGAVVHVESLPRVKIGENASVTTFGGGGEETLMICGGVTFEPAWHPLIEVLPQVITVNRDEKDSRPWLRSLFDLLKNEAGNGRPGSEAIITRLCDVLIMETIRDWIETAPNSTVGWLTALRDNQIGQAIAAIHNDPNYPWTVALLASKAGMSRSVFTERFTMHCRIPPLQYVIRLRMNLAGDWLQQTQLTTSEVADKLGYSSDATFGRAFKRFWGIAPGMFRRQPAEGHQLTGKSMLVQI